LKQVQAMCEIIDKSESARTNAIKMLQLQDRIRGLTSPVILPHRKFVEEGEACRVSAGLFLQWKAVRLICFNDVLMMTDLNYLLWEQCYVVDCFLLPLQPHEVEFASSGSRAHVLLNDDISLRGFHIVREGNVIPVTLIFQDIFLRNKWYDLIETQIHCSRNASEQIKSRLLNGLSISLMSE